MAKVEGPLMSLGARGKVADTLVFFPWKGRHVVRRWLKPTNPKSTLQGYVRAALSAIARGIKAIDNVASNNSGDSEVYSLQLAKAPAGMNWNGFVTQGAINAFMDGGAFSKTKFDAELANYAAMDATAKGTLDTGAATLGLADFAFEYGYTETIKAGFQLYLIALSCYNNVISASAPYSVHPKNYTAANASAFVAAMQAA